MAFPGPCGFAGSEAPQRAETRSSCLSDPQVKDEDKSLAVKRPGKEDGAKQQPSEKRPIPTKTAPAPPQQAAPGPASQLCPSEEAQRRLERIFTAAVIPGALVLVCHPYGDGEARPASVLCVPRGVLTTLRLATSIMVPFWVALAAGDG